MRAGRDLADLAREFERSSRAIGNGVAQADRQEGRREAKPAAVAGGVLSAAERDELARLRRENKPLRLERDILSRAAAGTLVERTTRFTMLLHLPPMDGHGCRARVKNGPALAGHGADAVRDAIAREITGLPEQLRRSLTWDQGAEMAQRARLRIDTGVAVYFCDPHSPWQRGTSENTNGLRQYLPRALT